MVLSAGCASGRKRNPSRIFAPRNFPFSLRTHLERVKRTVVQVLLAPRAISSLIRVNAFEVQRGFQLSTLNAKLCAWLTAPFWLEFSPKPSSSIPATRCPGFAKRATCALSSTSIAALSAPTYSRHLPECACSPAPPGPARKPLLTNTASGLTTNSSAAAKSFSATSPRSSNRIAPSRERKLQRFPPGSFQMFHRKLLDTHEAKLQYPRH